MICNLLKAAMTMEEFIVHCVWLEVQGPEHTTEHARKILDWYMANTPR